MGIIPNHMEVDIMAVNSISNTTAAYMELNKADQKTQTTVQNTASPAQTAREGSNTMIQSGKEAGTENQQKNDAEANAKRMKSIVNDTNNKIKGVKRKCEFVYHEDIKRVSIKVIDEETQEVIKQIPAEETLEMIQKLWEVAGLLMDEKR